MNPIHEQIIGHITCAVAHDPTLAESLIDGYMALSDEDRLAVLGGVLGFMSALCASIDEAAGPGTAARCVQETALELIGMDS